MTRATFAAAMVLGAGRGERMSPLSTVLPKPALPLPDGPVIGSALRLAADAGITRAVVNVWHRAARMAEAVAEVEISGMTTSTSSEDDLMGTAGGLALAHRRGLLGERGPVLVINGDCVLGLDLSKMIARHLAGDDLVTLALLPHLDPENWSRVALDADGRVDAIRPRGRPETGEIPFLYPGVMAVSRTALEGLRLEPGEIPAKLWEPARLEGRLGGSVVPGHWREVGTPTDYWQTVVSRLAGTSVVALSARVASAATIENSLIGRDAAVGRGAVVIDSVVTEGATVASGARVVRSVLMGSIQINADDIVIGQILAREPEKPTLRR
jgi:NDP-sugar pyrophosphorylase family protein